MRVGQNQLGGEVLGEEIGDVEFGNPAVVGRDVQGLDGLRLVVGEVDADGAAADQPVAVAGLLCGGGKCGGTSQGEGREGEGFAHDRSPVCRD